MRSVYVRLQCIVLVSGFGATALGQAELRLIAVDPVDAVINPGQTIMIDVFVDGVPAPGLRAYQTQIEFSGGTSGALELADQSPLDNTSIFINKFRSDFVFLGQSSIFDSVNVADMRITAALLSGGVEVTELKYCGTYILKATTDALGVFQVDFTDPNATDPTTFLRGPGGATDVIPVDVFGVTVTITIAPPNDDCVDRSVITDGVRSFRTEFGTLDGPTLPPSCDEGSGTAFGPDIWYEYTATCTGPLAITTCDQADFDTRIVVYGDGSGTCACPADNTNLVACNDNAAGCSIGTSEVVLSATAGECYTIRVGSADGVTTGNGNLTVICVGNDECAAAEPLTLPTSVVGSTENTNPDLAAPTCGTPIDSPGVWYLAVAPADGRMTASLCGGATFDTRLSVYGGASCAALTCVANANDTCGSQEEVSWCATAGTTYRILVHGVGGATGSFTLDVTADGCNDGDACTDDFCSGAVCIHLDNYDPIAQCCNPANGAVCALDDGNACTTGTCDPATGVCTHTPLPDGINAGCDDALDCTLDECINGACVNTDINAMPCTNSAQCPGELACDGGVGLCVCVESVVVAFVSDPGSLPNDTCYATGELITIRLDLEFSPTPIITGQFSLEYDSSTLSFVSMVPGNTVDPSSPFNFELGESVDTVGGTITYGVGVQVGGSGTVEPATMAVLTFQVLAECDPFLRVRTSGGPPTVLTDDSGRAYDPIFDAMPVLGSNASPPAMTACPANISVNPDPGLLTAVVSWTTPTAADSCDGAVPVVCAPASGSVFPDGTTTVACNTVNSCGVQEQCTFDVTVVPATLTTDLELSPIMAAGPIVRCITFELHDCTGGTQTTVTQDVTFTNGVVSGAVIPIPTGNWDCVTARDARHTLRSTAADMATTGGLDYTATFTGDGALGGHRLVGGNLNDDLWVDTQDYVFFLQQYLQPLDPNTLCGTAGLHADINGDGVVNVADLGHIQIAMFEQSQPNCCGLGGRVRPGPRSTVSIHELYRRGLGHLRSGDMNKDGRLDRSDISRFIEVYGVLEAADSPPPQDRRPDVGDTPAKPLDRRMHKH